MGPHVLIQVAGIRERFTTTLKCAFEGFFPRMNPHVYNQLAGSDACYLTTSVCTLMLLRTRWHAAIIARDGIYLLVFIFYYQIKLDLRIFFNFLFLLSNKNGFTYL